MRRERYEGAEALRIRVLARTRNETSVAVLIVAPLLVVARALDLITDSPLWFLLTTLIVGTLIRVIGTAAFPAVAGWRLWAHVGCQVVPAGIVMYAIGWGPTLAIGFIFCVAESFREIGAKASLPATVWSVTTLALGEIAIATGLVSTLVDEPLVHGLAALAAVGVVFTIVVISRATRETEAVEAHLREREEHFRALVQNAADIIIVGTPDGEMRYASPAFESVLGYPLSDVIDMSGFSLVHEEDLDSVLALFSMPFDAAPHHLEVRLRHHDGSWHWFDVSLTDLTDNPAVGAWVANLHDTTERKASEAALAELQGAFRHAFEDAPNGIVFVDVNGYVLRANRSFTRLVDIPADELVDASIIMLTHPNDRLALQLQHQQLLQGEVAYNRLETRCLRPDGTILWVNNSTSLVRDEDGRPLYFVIQVEDVTERKSFDGAADGARHDSRTGLVNRTMFGDQVERVLAASARAGLRAAVLIAELEYFNVVDDGLARTIGDELLMTVAHRLRSVLRSRDVVARIGENRFGVLCGEITGAGTALDVAERMASALDAPVQLHEGDVFITPSIGIILSEPGDNAETLMRQVDAAMYRASTAAQSRVHIFDRRGDDGSTAMLKTGSDLHRALERNEFVLHYQPIVELQDGHVVGAEALLRWNHPERGLLLPPEFLHVAEETGLMLSIGEWVLKTACRDAAEWRASARDESRASGLFVSVNLSPRQLADPALGTTIRKALADTGLSGSVLCVEITEQSLLYGESALRALETLRELGVRVSIDDFGSGLSSFARLKRVPIETLKIDRSFVSGVAHDSELRQIVEAVVGLARTLGLRTLAEGVENAAQLNMLRALGCDYAQGYYLGRPEARDASQAVTGERVRVWTPTP